MNYSGYDFRGNQIDLFPYKDVKISIAFPLNLENENLNLYLASFFLSQGINIYNRTEEIYNDRCFIYNEDSKDLSRSNRIDKIYKNISFCEDECSLISINYMKYQIPCECPCQKVNMGSIVKESEIVSKITTALDESISNYLPVIT